MNKKTYSFTLTSGSIPGIPSDQPDGLFHAGLLVDVDLDEMKVLSTRLINPETGETATSTRLVDSVTQEDPLLSSFMTEKKESTFQQIIEEVKDTIEEKISSKTKKSE